ncbi:MAG: CoA transferase [Balneolaceae bacterium]|nr:CoA transferase [Balneolaceae bacterium]MCH8550102.1 CoA transferase [Balneolaceae bacterium]
MKRYEPLKGITVVAIEQALSAPLASCRLADAGARVIKVERESGDFARDYDEVVKGQSTYFVWANRGKESVRINIKSEDGQKLLCKLISRADVFIQNLAPGSLRKLDLHSEKLRETFPSLITCDISGYGEDGEHASMKAYDNLVQAETGLIDVTGDGEIRAKTGISIADISTGIQAYAAILEAVINRKETGEGVAIKLSMFDSMADWMMVPWLHQKYGGSAPPRTGVHHAAIAPYGPFKTSDGREVMIGIQNEREWRDFCNKVMGGEISDEDERFSSNSLRVENSNILKQLIRNRFERFTHTELLTLLKDARIAYANLNTMEQFANHPRLRLVPVETEAGEVLIADLPARVEGFKRVFRPVPALGEHDQMIRKEFENEL